MRWLVPAPAAISRRLSWLNPSRRRNSRQRSSSAARAGPGPADGPRPDAMPGRLTVRRLARGLEARRLELEVAAGLAGDQRADQAGERSGLADPDDDLGAAVRIALQPVEGVRAHARRAARPDERLARTHLADPHDVAGQAGLGDLEPVADRDVGGVERAYLPHRRGPARPGGDVG